MIWNFWYVIIILWYSFKDMILSCFMSLDLWLFLSLFFSFSFLFSPFYLVIIIIDIQHYITMLQYAVKILLNK